MKGKFFQVFKAGNYPQGNFSAEDVAAISDRYDPAFCEAAITIDHAATGPAWGWVEGLKTENGLLMASFKDLVAEFREAVESRQYKRVSVEIFRDIDVPGKGPGPYLKAVSFLGAAAPQVKGLEPVTFSAGENIEVLHFEMDEEPAKMVLIPEADFTAFSAVEARIQTLQNDLKTAQERITKFADMEAEKLKAEERLRNHYMTSRKNDFAAWANEQIVYGRVTPAQLEDILKILEALDAVVSFSDEGVATEPPAVSIFKNLIGSLQPVVPGGPVATKPDGTEQDDSLASYSDVSLDPERVELHKKTVAIQRKNGISYDQALSLAMKQ